MFNASTWLDRTTRPFPVAFSGRNCISGVGRRRTLAARKQANPPDRHHLLLPPSRPRMIRAGTPTRFTKSDRARRFRLIRLKPLRVGHGRPRGQSVAFKRRIRPFLMPKNTQRTRLRTQIRLLNRATRNRARKVNAS